MITKFQRKVYNLVRKIPKGKVTTYKILAKKLKTSARAVGQALKRNPWPKEIPCYKVIKNNGEIGGYSLGVEKKIRLLKREGIKIKKNKIQEISRLMIGDLKFE